MYWSSSVLMIMIMTMGRATDELLSRLVSGTTRGASVADQGRLASARKARPELSSGSGAVHAGHTLRMISRSIDT
jgi:hypothetical protein